MEIYTVYKVATADNHEQMIELFVDKEKALREAKLLNSKFPSTHYSLDLYSVRAFEVGE